MNRECYLVLRISVLLSTLSFTPFLLAQIDAPIENHVTLNDGINDDTAITTKVKAALTDDKNTSGATDAIHVQTNGGVVTLMGDVASQAMAERAQMVVAQVSGVRDVGNDLKYPHGRRSRFEPHRSTTCSLRQVGMRMRLDSRESIAMLSFRKVLSG